MEDKVSKRETLGDILMTMLLILFTVSIAMTAAISNKAEESRTSLEKTYEETQRVVEKNTEVYKEMKIQLEILNKFNEKYE